MLDELQEDGSSTRDHMRKHFESTGEMPDLLKPVDCLPESLYIWRIYCRMTRRRQGMNALSNSDIEAWLNVRGIRLSAFELDILDAIEAVWSKLMTRRIQEQQQRAEANARRK